MLTKSESPSNKAKIAAVILAAGKGTRMGNANGSDIPKVMFELSGVPIIRHSVSLTKKSGIEKIVLVVGYKKELIENYFGDEVEYAAQKEQLGTGHAAMMAKGILGGNSEAVIVFYGDNPLYKSETVRRLINVFETEKPTVAMLSAVSENPFGYGRVIRNKSGEVLGIKEHKDCSDDELKIKEWNPGFYIFDSDWLWENFDKLKTNNVQHEYYLTDMIGIARSQGKKVIAMPVSEESEALGINTLEQLKQAEAILVNRKL